MKDNITLLDKAYENLSAAKILLRQNSGDDLYCNIVAYLLQQAIELSIKYQFEQEGIKYPHEHDITILLQWGRKHGISAYVTGYIEDFSDMISNWESKTRYITNYLVELCRIQKALPEIEKSLDMCKENCKPFIGRDEQEEDFER